MMGLALVSRLAGRRLRRWLVPPLVLGMLAASLPVLAAAPSFSDVPPGYWAYNAIEDLAARGIVSGVGGGEFLPASPLTRAQFAALLVRAENWTGSPGPSFADVPSGAWFTAVVTAAAGQDVVQGTGPDTFSPDAPITRAQAAVILVRTLGLNHVADDEAKAALPYSDAASIPSWAVGGVAVATGLGLTLNTNGPFLPDQVVTRADAAVMVDALLHVTPAQVAAAGDAVAASVHVLVDQLDLAPGGQTTAYAYVHDAAGHIIPASVDWTATDGSLSAAASVSTGGAPGSNVTPSSTVTFTAGAAGNATVTASVPGGGPSGSISLEVDTAAGVQVSTATDLASVGTPVALSASVVDPSGSVDQADNGSTIGFQISGSGAAAQTLTAADSSGQASVDWTPAAAGSYTVQASDASLGSSSSSSVLVVQGTPYSLSLSTGSSGLVPGVATAVQAQMLDAAGKPVGADVPVTLTASAGLSLSATSAYLSGGSGTLAQVTGVTPGPATLTATVPGGAVAPATLSLQVSSLGNVVPEPSTPVVAGDPATVGFQIVSTAGQAVTSAAGEALDVQVTDPNGNSWPDVEPTISGDAASFSFTPQIAGTWTFSAVLPGYTDPKTATLQVQPGPVSQLIVDPVPTSILLPGQSAQVHAWLGDAYGNVAGTQLTLSGSLVSGSGTVGAASATSSGPVLSFSSASTGVSVVRFSSPDNPSLAPVDVTFRTVPDVAGKVAGKGMWLLFGDWLNTPDSTLLSTAVADGITHLYLEVDTSHDGFYGGRALDDLLRQAHDDGIAVVAWVYPYLDDPATDVTAAQQVIAFRTPHGALADGLAADIEEQLGATAVSTYAQGVRQALTAAGPYAGPFVGVVLPPDQSPGYPYAALAPYVDVWAPMDYWDVAEHDYTYAEVYTWVAKGMATITSAAGRGGIPFDPILQAFNELSLPFYDPSAEALTAAAQAALQNGAPGVSFYRWGTADAAQWAAIAALSVPAPAAGASGG